MPKHHFSQSWLFVSITEAHFAVVKDLNTQHDWESDPPDVTDQVWNNAPDDSPRRNTRQDTAPFEDPWITYGLGPSETPILRFGRISKERCEEMRQSPVRLPTDPDFILDGGIDINTGRNSKISTDHCRLFFNENGAWMFEDTSRHGCTVNGRALCGKDRQTKASSTVSTVALRPDAPNLIEVPSVSLKIQIGTGKPQKSMTWEAIDPPGQDVQSMTSTAKSTVGSLSTSLSAGAADYYRLASSPESLGNLLLMGVLDGKSYVGYEYTDIAEAQNKYEKMKHILDFGADYGILPFVDGTILDGRFVAITELPSGIPLSLGGLDPPLLSFVLVQVLEKIRFLQLQNVEHGNISADTILVGDSFPVQTELTGFSLCEKQPKCPEHDVTALGQVIINMLKSSNIDWEECPIGPYLKTCLRASQEKLTWRAADQILKEMQIDGDGSTSLPFETSVSLRRGFQITWLRRKYLLVRREDLHRVINAIGTPRQPAIIDRSVRVKHDEWPGHYIHVKHAQTLLTHHGIHTRLTRPSRDEQEEFARTTFYGRADIRQHFPSGMCNVSQLLNVLPDLTTTSKLPEPDRIQEVRGDPRTAGFYISKSSFDVIVAVLKEDFEIITEDDPVLVTETSPCSFERVEFEETVLIPTGWATPRFLKLSRTGRPQSNLDPFCLSSLHECQLWFKKTGLNNQADQLDGLQQPFSTEWRAVPIVESESTVLSTTAPSISSSDSDYLFQFGTLKRRKRARAVIDPPADFESSEDGSDTTTVIPPAQGRLRESVASWRRGNQLNTTPSSCARRDEDDSSDEVSCSDTIRLSQYDLMTAKSKQTPT